MFLLSICHVFSYKPKKLALSAHGHPTGLGIGIDLSGGIHLVVATYLHGI